MFSEKLNVFFQSTALLYFLFALMGLVAIALFFVIGWYFCIRSGSRSPFTGQPFCKGRDLPYPSACNVYTFLQEYESPLNPLFSLHTSAVCRDTGRIFPNSLNTFGVIKVSKNYLNQRMKASWVSWDKLDEEDKQRVQLAHTSLEDFSLEEKSSLFLDPESLILIGWRSVPNTELAVLQVQQPNE